MEKKKTFKVKIKAQNGQRMNPWQMEQSPYQYPAYQPIQISDYSNQMPPLSGYDNIAPQNQMEVQPMEYTQSSTSQPSNNTGRNIGNIASGVGRMAGQALNAVMTGGSQLINALLPEQSRYREDRTLQRAYNPYPQGNSSQALYRNGGSVDRFTKLSDEEAAYYYMNNIPLPQETRQDYIEPITNQYYQPQFQPVEVPQPYIAPQRNISYNRMLDVTGQPTAYLPQFEGFDYNEATQALNQLPSSISGLPVVRNNYQDFFQGFQPNSQSNEWIPYDYDEYNPQPLTSFKCGGKMKAESGIKINPKNKGKFTQSAQDAGMGVQEFASHVLANKEDYSTTQIKRANFARNFGGKKQHGGYIAGQEVELSPSEIKRLLSLGYELDIL